MKGTKVSLNVKTGQITTTEYDYTPESPLILPEPLITKLINALKSKGIIKDSDIN